MKLIQIEKDHYIIVDSSDIKEGDVMYDIDGDIGIAIGKDKSQWVGNMKIIYSFGKKIDGVINKPLSEVEELLFGHSVEKMAESKSDRLFTGLQFDTLYKTIWNEGFKVGFNAHKELEKDNFFSVDDMLRVFKHGILFNQVTSSNCKEAVETEFDLLIKSIKPKTEWEVEYIYDKLTLKQ